MRNCSFFATLIIFLFLSINVEAFYESTIDCKYLSIEKRKKLICDDGRLLKLSCVDGDWSTQNSLCVGSKPIELKKSITSTTNVANRSKKYVAVVISGQLGRVEIKSKLKFLLGSTRPIPIDVELQLFLIVGNQKLQFSKGAVRVLQSVEYFGEIFNGNLQQLIDLISQQSIWPLVTYQYNQTAMYETEYPTTSDWYLEGDESRSHRGATHVLQFDGLLRAEMLIEAFERKHERRFDYVLRLRDDALLLKPLSWNSIFRRLENSDTIVPRCISHGGVNDHVAFFKRKALNAMFSKPLDLLHGPPFNPKPRRTTTEFILGKSLEMNNLIVSFSAPCELPMMYVRSRGENNSLCVVATIYHSLVTGRWCKQPDHLGMSCSPQTGGLIPQSWLKGIAVCPTKQF